MRLNLHLRKGAQGLALAAGYLLLAVMLLTVIAVLARKVFALPIIGTQDLSEAGLVIIVFLGLAYAGLTGGHIAVDLISGFLDNRVSNILEGTIRLIGAVFFSIVTWQTVEQGFSALEYGEAFNLLPIPHYPFFFIVAFGTGLYAIVLLTLSARSFAGRSEYESS